MSTFAVRASRIYTPHEILDDAGIVVHDRVIEQVARWSQMRLSAGVPIHDVRPNFLAPGLIDLHIHGAAGHDYMDGADEDFDAICRWHAQGGTTSLLATTCAAPMSRITAVLKQVHRWQNRQNQGARVLGAHVEGPFFNISMRGCHLPEHVKNPTPQDIDALLEHRAAIRHLTIAPEIEGALEAIERLANEGVSIAVAHSNATSHEVDEAIRRGLRHVTHLFNAMSVYHQRGPNRVSGVAETALVRDELTVELIADGYHVNPLRMKLALKAKGVERTCLVTDAMRGAGMPDGAYAFGPRDGKIAFVRNGLAVMPEGTGFASSTIPMIRCVQVMTEQLGVSLQDSLTMATANPARVIGLDQRKGSLKPGMDADFIVLNDNLSVQMTIVEGWIVYESDNGSHNQINGKTRSEYFQFRSPSERPRRS